MRRSLGSAALFASVMFCGAACTAITGVTDLVGDLDGGGSAVVDGSSASSASSGSTSSSSTSSTTTSSTSGGGTTTSSTSSSSSSSTSGGGEAGLEDVTTDMNPPPPPPPTPVLYECVPVAADSNQGLLINATGWSGFRFEVTGTKPVTTTSIGFRASTQTAGQIFGAIVKLDSATDTPNSNDLTTNDVLKFVVFALPDPSSNAQNVSAPITITLTPGWYAVVFGAGAHGAGAASAANMPLQSGSGGCVNGGGYPFTLIQNATGFVNQAATPHLEVRGTTP